MGEHLTMLVNQCLAGDQSSFQELIQRFRGQVYGLCYRMLGQREDAEDATQETFFRVARHLHRWDSSRGFEPWLLTIAGNRCRTRLAKRKRRPKMLTLDGAVEDRSVELEKAKTLSEEIDWVLESVRPEYRDAFVMFHKQGMAYCEIADSLDVPLGTVKTWVHRARQEMISKLKKRGVIGGS